MFVQQVNVINENNMYTAIENDHYCKLEEYEHTRGEPPVDAANTDWFRVTPPVLFLRINRTKYNYRGRNEKM